jgi:hypothetical protein
VCPACRIALAVESRRSWREDDGAFMEPS